MGRSTFNWWRRNKKRKTLPKYHPLLSRIRNGDFDTSQYMEEAQVELDEYTKIVNKCYEQGKIEDLRHETIVQRIFDEGDQYIRRYNRLMKDFYTDEDRILKEIDTAFRKQFGQYLPHLYERWLDGEEPDMTLEELYHKCKEMKDNNNPVSRGGRRKKLSK